MTEYVPLTVEMLDVFECGECEWTPKMRRLMWQERAHYGAEAERLSALVDEWQTTGDAIMRCATGKPGPLSDSDVCGVIRELQARHTALVKAVREVVESGAPASPMYNRCKYCRELLQDGHAPDCAWSRLTVLVRQEEAADANE